MSNDFCRQIDEKMLVEEYVAGRLKGDLLKNFEEHIEKCEKHAQAVLLEKALKRGISEFARSEIKTKLQKRLEKQNDTRFIMIRYAAILLVAVITPLIIYYQFNVAPQNLQKINTLSKKEKDRNEQNPIAPAAQEEIRIKAEDEAPPTKIISGSGEDAPTTPRQMSTSRKETDSERDKQKASVEDAGIAYSATEEIADNSLPEIALTKSSPGSMLGASGRSINIPNIYAELQERTLRDSTDIIDCIETHLDSTHLQDYFLLCKIQIIKSGEISLVEVINASVRSEELELCLRSIMKEWMVSTGDATKEIEYKISYSQFSKSEN